MAFSLWPCISLCHGIHLMPCHKGINHILLVICHKVYATTNPMAFSLWPCISLSWYTPYATLAKTLNIGRRALCSFKLAHTMEADILKSRKVWAVGKTSVVPNIIT